MTYYQCSICRGVHTSFDPPCSFGMSFVVPSEVVNQQRDCVKITPVERAAGTLIIRVQPEGLSVLCLKIYGRYDLPKGRIEGSETEFEAALRETHEEAGVTLLNFPWGQESITLKHPKRPKQVTFFLCSTSQEPVLLENPLTGKFEHHAIAWLTLDDAEQRVHMYLRPAITWVKRVLFEKGAF